jgi:putative ABC transport system ATP-binding protein
MSKEKNSPAENDYAVVASSITKTYGKGSSEQTVLNNVSLKITRGTSVAIVGKSGSGKSTLMHVLAGLDRPTSGTVTAEGRSIWELSKSELNVFRNSKIGFIFQTFYMQPAETVMKNVMLPSEIAGVPLNERKVIAMESLKQLDMEDKAQNRASDLSGGQKQRVCIARAISTKPSILFADEPTGNLDSTTGESVEKMLFDLNKQSGSTLIVVTHDEDLARRLDAQVFVKDGIIEKIEGKGAQL